ncbi:MAG: hypothetical protein IPI73_24575 [Betaproteobacteria bacterium]|nr:hypothetical protein [Betaproteobacteria bacterium]
MDIFRLINGKAQGLSGSLLDYTEARLVEKDLNVVKPELYLALRLHEDPRSPWYQRLDLGGKRTVGTKRVASLRTMQTAARRFLRMADWPMPLVGNEAVQVLMDFWKAVAYVLPQEWSTPRSHMLTKGIGVYCLMSLAGELTKEAGMTGRRMNLDYFIGKLSDFLDRIDWSNQGPLHGFGGVSGADAAFSLLKQVRRETGVLDKVHA